MSDDKGVKILTRYGELEIPDNKDEVLVGYTGKTKVDAGVFYCPYVPLMVSGVMTEEERLKREIRIIEEERAVSERARKERLLQRGAK